ncbi:putative branchpoint-bridging protein-like isoform X1 [Sesbania bispinosa]|nr:putative branchpoint-bridging protein-like isoform X1 [Sesbania bispinosa]
MALSCHDLLSCLLHICKVMDKGMTAEFDSTYAPEPHKMSRASSAAPLVAKSHLCLLPNLDLSSPKTKFQETGAKIKIHGTKADTGDTYSVSNPPGLARTPHFPSQTMNPSNTASAFGSQPVPVAGLHPIIPNQHVSMQGPPSRQILQQSHMTQASPLGHIGQPRNPSMISVLNLSAPTNASTSFPVTLSQPTPIGQLKTPVSLMPQPMSGISPSPMPNHPLTPLGVSSGQSGGPVTVQMSVGLSNVGPMAPPAVPPTRPVSLGPQPDVAFKPPQSNMLITPRSSTFPPHQAGISPRPPSSLGPMPPPIPAPTHSSVNHLSGPVSFPSPGLSPSLPLPRQSGMPNSASGVTPYHTHVKPPVLMTSNSGNFTFQSLGPHADYCQVVSRPNSQATTQGVIQEPPSGPRPPPFGLAVPDQPLQMFPRTQVPSQVNQTHSHVSAIPFGGRSGSVSIPPRHTVFPYAGQPSPRSPVPPIGMKNFISAPQMPNLPTPGARSGMHIGQSYPAQRTWSDIPMPLNQKFGNNPCGF